MGMMAKMRSLAPWFIITVGGVFVLFMVVSDSRVMDIIGVAQNDVGSVNDKKITYQEFSTFLDQARTNQVERTGKELDETQMSAFRDQIWDAIVSQNLIEQKIKEFGITVSDEEVREAILGPNPPQIITQYFIDSTGTFNREAYEAAIFNPQNKDAMLQAEDAVRQQKYQEKLQSMLSASVFVSDEEIKNNYIEQNTKMSADYALFDANVIPDSLVTISDDDLKDYYEEKKDDFKVDQQRKIKYVLFRKKASLTDTTEIGNSLVAIADKLVSDTSSFKTYVEIYSEQPYSRDTVSLSALPEAAEELFVSANKGDILKPVLTFEGYVLYRLVNKFSSGETFVRASHILIKSGDNPEDAKNRADEIYNELMAGADFAQLAKEKSEDGSAPKGGDLGWFGKGQMVEEFENAAFTGRLNEIQKPVKSQFGYHIIKVTGKSSEKFVVEKIVNKIVPSGATTDRLYNNAGDLAYLAGKSDFITEAELLKYQVVESPPFKKDASAIPGLGSNTALVKFAFENSVGDVSEVFNVPTGYVVAMIFENIPEGFKPFEEVEAQLKTRLLREKKLERSLEYAKKAYSKVLESGSLEAAKQIFEEAKTGKVEDFNLTASLTGIGRDLAFTGKALDAKLNEFIEPFKGTRGSFIIKVTNRVPFDSTAFSIQKNTLRDNLLQQKISRTFTEWLAKIKEEADIVDNRHLFYK